MRLEEIQRIEDEPHDCVLHNSESEDGFKRLMKKVECISERC